MIMTVYLSYLCTVKFIISCYFIYRQVDDCPPSDEYLFQESLLNYID